MWLNSDLSGKVNVTISIQEEVVRMSGMENDFTEESIRNQLQQTPGVKVDHFESFREAGKIIAKLQITFDALEKLTRREQGFKQATPASFLGAMTVTQDGRKTVFDRNLPAISQTHGKNFGEKLLVNGLSGILFAKNHLIYKLHLPGEILSSNSTHIDQEQHVVEWNYTLAQAMHEPPEMRVEWKRPARILLWLFISTGVLLFAIFIFIARGRRRL